MVFSAIKHVNGGVDTFVIFGAAHRYTGAAGAVYDVGRWLTPLGEVEIDEGLAGEIVAAGLADSNVDAHRNEHSIEVQVPFIQHLFPDAKIVPVIVPPVEAAVELGDNVGAIIDGVTDKKIICIASTDLTHYGPRYCFSPVGTGIDALKWASEVNDREFIDLALQMEPAKMLASAMENYNACGPGAAAAAVSVAKRLGKNKGVLLGHTDSNEVMKVKFDQSSDESVGYAGMVF
jgi:hypothetical protein